jgi:hypothetical protein
MLDQVVIDAEALREAAIKNAEQEVIEKYSGEIKEAVTSLLEQEEEDPFAAEDEMGLGDEGDVEDRESVVDQLGMAATEGENTCPCPEEGEPMVLDLDQIVAAAEGAAEEEGEIDLGMEEEPPDDEEELFEVNEQNLMSAIAEALSEEKDKEEDLTSDQKGEMDADDDGDIDEKDLAALRKAKKKEDEPKSEGRQKTAAQIFEDSEAEETYRYGDDEGKDKKELSDLKKRYQTDDVRKHEKALGYDMDYDQNRERRGEAGTHFRESQELDLTDEQINDILETLTVDIENVPSGMLFHTHPTKGESERGLDVALAHEQDTAFAEKQKELRQAIKKLEEQVKSQTLQLNKQKKDYKNLKSIAIKATKKLEEVNFSNAKLIYTNRILKSDSLNERQKEKLVEALSKVGSVEEAKIVYDTLCENLSSNSTKVPKTLNEAVSKNNPLILKSNTEKQPASQNQVERLRKLAGII